jgi:hypothetical protein
LVFIESFCERGMGFFFGDGCLRAADSFFHIVQVFFRSTTTNNQVMIPKIAIFLFS